MADIKPDEINCSYLRQQLLSNFNASADLEEVGNVLQWSGGMALPCVYGLGNVRSTEN